MLSSINISDRWCSDAPNFKFSHTKILKTNLPAFTRYKVTYIIHDMYFSHICHFRPMTQPSPLKTKIFDPFPTQLNLRVNPTLTLVGCSSPSVCLSVCLQHNSKTNDPSVQIWYSAKKRHGFGIERSKVKVTGSISAFFTLMTITPTLMYIWLTAAIQR